MRVAFYAPMKSPNHPVPSGDRLMARLLIRALELGGHQVDVASEFRTYASTPQAAAALEPAIGAELERLRLRWKSAPRPELWFCYHPYYKSPDPFGPAISAEFAIPYVTAESSYAAKRDRTGWAASQKLVGEAIMRAAVNISFTGRDQAGLAAAFAQARLARLNPFIDTALFETVSPAPDQRRLMTVAMMRAGDKMDSYVMLAKALRLIEDRLWTLAVIGDGPLRQEVEALFAGFPGRIEWLGERNVVEIAELLGHGGIYVWPGCGEAYGLAYLEAQAAGLPVVAQATAGVPAVVEAGVTGLLTPEGDVAAYARAIATLLGDGQKRDAMGQAARCFVLEERSLARAARVLDGILRRSAGTGVR
ncbi:glycosyltransferase family 4 protein [Rhizobium leguminosarum]|uniref:glycosyltransferase family 4 protein n=1 Tax=Rhizobium TaxID=379 RepID=UPI001389F4F9|nr:MULTISPECIES: glycosyltransferase family 4 protein [Rhizobium]MBY5405378.1 glycosyltransferase family 4 protein [Rhizobium leguminosarum]MBY5446021.1 glycosyltransferase family 4 protein [Rhizobium leguminosarum]NDK48154.1 glycosyltransferase family 4 protein [Rhizobium laguerreae]UWM85473.1 glycosyltransferase family 4 protein [Rhizobium leguminosarum bv. viciae]UWU32122.1 glycosyltransferase family 4 protein [Rhizobium leguminosarum bv. viciae]